MHKGFPEMVSYLYGYPSSIASHKFSTLYFDPYYLLLLGLLPRRLGVASPVQLPQVATAVQLEDDDCGGTTVSAAGPSQSKRGKSNEAYGEDYQWRSDVLSLCPLYFSLPQQK